MKLLLLGLVASVAAFDGSGSFEDTADLHAFLADQVGDVAHVEHPDDAQDKTCVGGYISGADLCKPNADGGYADCTVVTGFVALSAQAVENLDCLSNLKRIEGDDAFPCPDGNCLLINDNLELENIDGLRNLQVVPGGININGNPKLRSTLGLGEDLTHVGKNDAGEALTVNNNAALVDLGSSWDFFDGVVTGGISLEENAVLANIRGLHTVQEVDGGVKICGNEELKSLAGLEKLTMVGASDADGTGFDICDNLNLVDTSAVHGMVNIAGSLSVSNNAALQALSGYETIMNIGKNGNYTSVAIKNNGQLETLAIGATSVAGSIEIEDNPNLAVLDMSGLSTIGSNAEGQSVVVLRNDNLKDLQGLRGLQGALTGAITLGSNANLISLNGLQQVLSAGRDNSGVSLAITDNAALATTAGLAMTGTLKGAVHIMRNPQLKVLAGLQAVSEVGSDLQGVALKVYMNNVLQNLVGFKGLTGDIHGAIEVSGNAALSDLEGFESISSATAATIEENAHLISLRGLENVRGLSGTDTKGKSLTVVNNQNLVDANALQALTVVAGGIDIENNPQLHDVAGLVEGLSGATEVLIHDVVCLTQTDVSLLSDIASGDTSLQGATEAASVTSCTHKDDRDTLVSAKLNYVDKASRFGDADNTEVGDLADGHICGGTTSAEDELWKAWDLSPEMVPSGASDIATGLRIDVNTDKCDLQDDAPRYLTSVKGESAHWQLVGVNSVYNADKDSFRLNLWHPTLRGRYLLYFAARYRWGVNWLVDTSKRSGNTKAGATGWKRVPKTQNVIYADVNTGKSGFSDPNGAGAAPRYVTAIHGGVDHWRVQGAHAVYMPTTFGFRTFLVFPCDGTGACKAGDADNSDFGPEFAEAQEWRVVWAGSYDDRVSGISDNKWLSYRSSEEALQITVDTVLGMFTETPAFVTSISGRSHHWMVTGAGAIYDATAQSFKVFLDKAKDPKFALDHDWRVNYIAYQSPVNCTYNNWGDWGDCSATCGQGDAAPTETQTRTVKTKAYFGGACDEPLEQSQKCNEIACPVDCVMSSWGHFGECTETCGHGNHTRSRYVVTQDAHGGDECSQYDLEHTTSCKLIECPVDCDVDDWSSWSECSTSCGEAGRRTRTRSVTQIRLHNGTECPPLKQSSDEIGETCAIDELQEDWHVECPIQCIQGNWGDWGAVDKGTGAFVVNGCTRSEGENQGEPATCMDHAGRHTRTREILQQPSYGESNYYKGPKWAHLNLACEGTEDGTTENQFGPCNLDIPCPVDCVPNPWVPEWDEAECSVTCGGGTRWQTRTASVQMQHGGEGCGAMQRSEPCNEQECPQDCEYTEWTDWGTCSATCREEGGAYPTTTRTRHVATWANWGGQECEFGETHEESKACNSLIPCPIDCVMSDWGEDVAGADEQGFTGCDVACVGNGGNGNKVRTRFIKTHAKHGGEECPTDLTDTQECVIGTDVDECAVDCVLHEWSNWGSCSLDCRDTKGADVAGKRTRSRSVKTARQDFGENQGTDCPVKREDEQDCNDKPCPIDCVLPPWTDGDWETCTARMVDGNYCGGGRKTRTREAIQPALFEGVSCEAKGGFYEEEECGMQDCPVDCVLSTIWHDTSACSHTCGPDGTKDQELEILVAPSLEPAGLECGTRTRTVRCNDFACPVHCELNDWDYADDVWNPSAGTGAPCLKDGAEFTCTPEGGTPGVMTRKRTIKTEADHGGADCPASELLQETAICNWHACPVDCELSKWGFYLEDGVQKKFPDVVDEEDGWELCSATCRQDGGPSPMQIRKRTLVTWPLGAGAPCDPEREQQQNCNENNYCPIDCVMGDWSGWDACSATCGPGTQKRYRTPLVDPKHDGEACPTGLGGSYQEQNCEDDVCPVECEVGCKEGEIIRCDMTSAEGYSGTGYFVDAWYNWGDCEKPDGSPATCGGGRRTRTRDIVVQKSHDHFTCPKQEEDEECNTNACPIDCELGEWGKWNVCKDCTEKGQIYRERPITTEPNIYGVSCETKGGTREQEAWTMVDQYQEKCNGLGEKQGAWSACSKNCNSGHEYQLVSRAMCSQEAVVQLHYTFRRGRLCNVDRTCEDGESEWVSPAPAVPPLSLDEELNLDEEWHTLSPAEVRLHGLPTGHWQRLGALP